MIQLAYGSGVPYWLNEINIERLEAQAGGGTIIYTTNGSHTTAEDPEAVLELIAEAEAARIRAASGGGVGGAGVKDHSKCPCQVVLGGPPLNGGFGMIARPPAGMRVFSDTPEEPLVPVFNESDCRVEVMTAGKNWYMTLVHGPSGIKLEASSEEHGSQIMARRELFNKLESKLWVEAVKDIK